MQIVRTHKYLGDLTWNLSAVEGKIQLSLNGCEVNLAHFFEIGVVQATKLRLENCYAKKEDKQPVAKKALKELLATGNLKVASKLHVLLLPILLKQGKISQEVFDKLDTSRNKDAAVNKAAKDYVAAIKLVAPDDYEAALKQL